MKKGIKILLVVLILSILVSNLIFFEVLYPYLLSKDKILKSNIKEPTYVALYVGDIDGGVSEDWFPFYEKITKFHNDNEISTCFSFYPGSIGDDEEFNKIFEEMYTNEYIELMQKGYRGDVADRNLYKLPAKGQKEIIKLGQDYFKKKMKEILDEEYIKLPVAYNQLSGRINNDTRQVLEELGFKIYFDMFIEDDMDPVESTATFDVIEYGASFTDTGEAGREHDFKSPAEIFKEINELKREDLTMMAINGRKVIPLWTHQQDFEDEYIDEKIDEKKWEIYTNTIKALNQDPNVILITPTEIYDLRH